MRTKIKPMKAPDYIPEKEARILAAMFQANSHMQVGNDFRLYSRDTNGNKVKLKSWFMKIEDLEELLEDSRQKILSQNKALSGIRVYPALQNKNNEGNTVPEYHTLLIVAAYFDSNTGRHENILLGKVQEYVEPCPVQCPSKQTDLL